MDKQRLQELAGINAEYLKNATKEELGQFDELTEELKPENGKEFTQRDWNMHIGHIVDIILHMAKSDAEGDEKEFVDNAEQYMEDAFHDIKATIKQRVRSK